MRGKNESLAESRRENAEMKKSVEKLFEEVENAPSLDSVKEVLSSIKSEVEQIEENTKDYNSEELY